MSAYGKKFIKKFDLGLQRAISGFFRKPIKNGINDPNQIIEKAVLRSESPKFHGKYAILRDIVSKYYQDVLAYISYLQYVEQLPPEAKSVIEKQSNREYFQEQKMSKCKPSWEQLDYLRKLGYIGHQPATMLEASYLIDRLR